MAMATCENILSTVKKSGLNFIIQETPFSAHLTIRKTYCNYFQNPMVSEDNHNKQSNEKIAKLEKENIHLKKELQESAKKFEIMKNENQDLQQRLADAEKEMLKQFTDTKLSDAKMAQEISSMKQKSKKSNDKILELTLEVSKEEQKVKSLEKSIAKLEAKNKNKAEQLENLKSDTNNNKKDKDKLEKEVKILKDKVSKAKPKTSISTQTEETNIFPVSESSPVLTKAESCQNVKCLVCSETFMFAKDFKDHSKDQHNILIDVKILENPVEEDDFTRMLKSILVDAQYLQERVRYYPAHWDNIDLRIKIRMIAKMKYEGISRQIDELMMNTYSRKTLMRGLSNEI